MKTKMEHMDGGYTAVITTYRTFMGEPAIVVDVLPPPWHHHPKCRAGHRMTPENTYTYTSHGGKKYVWCKRCRADRELARWRKANPGKAVRRLASPTNKEWPVERTTHSTPTHDALVTVHDAQRTLTQHTQHTTQHTRAGMEDNYQKEEKTENTGQAGRRITR